MAEKLSPLTVREVIQQLSRCTDMDAEVSMSVINSDPISIVRIDEQEDGSVQFLDEVSAKGDENVTETIE